MSKTKQHNLGVRVDDDLNQEINHYAEQVDRTVAQLFRMEIREYMWAHPLTTDGHATKSSLITINADNLLMMRQAIDQLISESNGA